MVILARWKYDRRESVYRKSVLAITLREVLLNAPRVLQQVRIFQSAPSFLLSTSLTKYIAFRSVSISKSACYFDVTVTRMYETNATKDLIERYAISQWLLYIANLYNTYTYVYTWGHDFVNTKLAKNVCVFRGEE